MRSRAVLLPHPADPFMLYYWIKLYERVWRDEVDKLYIYVNSPIEKPVIDYMRDLCSKDPKIHWMYYPQQIEHGAALNEMLEMVTEDHIMLIEDDGLIFRSGWVNKYFTMLENGLYDLVGSPRGSCSMEIWNASKEKYNLDYSGYGDVGPNFWPCFLFAKRATLLATDRDFGAHHWPKGSHIEQLNYTVQEDGCYGDTFVHTSMQLRAMIQKDRILTIPQFHAAPQDYDDFLNHTNLFSGQAYWIHLGSMSSGTHGLLKDDQGRSLARRTIDPPQEVIYNNKPTTEMEILEYERRVQWWLRFIEFWHQENKEFTNTEFLSFASEYNNAITRLIQAFCLSPSRITKRQQIYRSLGL